MQYITLLWNIFSQALYVQCIAVYSVYAWAAFWCLTFSGFSFSRYFYFLPFPLFISLALTEPLCHTWAVYLRVLKIVSALKIEGVVIWIQMPFVFYSFYLFSFFPLLRPTWPPPGADWIRWRPVGQRQGVIPDSRRRPEVHSRGRTVGIAGLLMLRCALLPLCSFTRTRHTYGTVRSSDLQW